MSIHTSSYEDNMETNSPPYEDDTGINASPYGNDDVLASSRIPRFNTNLGDLSSNWSEWSDFRWSQYHKCWESHRSILDHDGERYEYHYDTDKPYHPGGYDADYSHGYHSTSHYTTQGHYPYASQFSQQDFGGPSDQLPPIFDPLIGSDCQCGLSKKLCGIVVGPQEPKERPQSSSASRFSRRAKEKGTSSTTSKKLFITVIIFLLNALSHKTL